jgi:methylthioxylose transferase
VSLLTRPRAPDERAARGARADLIAGALALAFVAAATAVGFLAEVRLFGSDGFPGAPPTFGEWPILGKWLPHVGPGTPLAIMLAVAAVAWGPALGERLTWRRALAGSYLLAVGWILALALVDGWQSGVADQLTTRDEYLSVVPGITDIPAMLHAFTARILESQPDSWPTHVAGHPPGATLVFVWLDRIGLSGGGWAAVVCVLAAAALAVAVPVTIRALGRADLARAALPFVALLPGAVWLGVSADGMFAGVTATGIALLAVGARAGGAWLPCLAGGVLLGFGIFLSYGLVLMAPIALAVVWAIRRWRALVPAVLGALTVVVVFALAGFWWLDGYQLVVQRYHEGIAADRPYGYWVWANLACLVLAVGPAAAAGLRRAVAERDRALAVVGAAALAVLVADLSGLSKAEVERIWLPFAVWLVLAAALLPAAHRRWWLAAQAATALVVNHLLFTNW